MRGEQWGRRWLAAMVAVAGISLPVRHAAAFCRTTTCDEEVDPCPRDANGCLTTGKPLFWKSPCLSFGLQRDAARSQGLTYDAVLAAVRDAFGAWLNAECGGEPPSIRVWDLGEHYGPFECGHSEFNQCAPNANVVLFRNDHWDHTDGANVLGFTNVTFRPTTGEILDADIEINAVTTTLTLSDRGVADDLRSILTHEVGHFLGLDHSDEAGATMQSEARRGSIELRTLAADDVLGLCTIYPPGRDAPECSSPRTVHGVTRQCVQTEEEAKADSGEDEQCGAQRGEGCSCRAVGRADDGRLFWVLAAVVVACRLRRANESPRAHLTARRA